MWHSLFLFVCCSVALSACAQGESKRLRIPHTETWVHQLGDTPVPLTVQRHAPPSPFYFVHLHDNEQTAKAAVTALLPVHGGTLVSLDNDGRRNIRFSLQRSRHEFDPNRMFSASGIATTLRQMRSAAPAAEDAIAAFARFVLAQLPDTAVVVAVHNNSDGRYGIRSYLQTLRAEADSVYINPDMDNDDFVLTTHAADFALFRQQQINAVLQRNAVATDDGSLSVLWGRQGKRYINVEAQFGHAAAQKKMLAVLLQQQQ